MFVLHCKYISCSKFVVSCLMVLSNFNATREVDVLPENYCPAAKIKQDASRVLLDIKAVES